MSASKEKSMRYVLCDCAESNSGKSEFLLQVIDELTNTRGYSIKKEADLRDINKSKNLNDRDRWIVLVKDGKEIIIQTEGDYKVSFNNTYAYINDHDVDVIICASRLDAKIKERVLDLKNRYTVIFFQHFIQEDGSVFLEQGKSVENFCEIVDSL